MQEGLLSLLQMSKTSAALARMAQARLPFISVLTDPTTGGVSASLAMLGDLNIGEPRALIGFAGPRVIEQTVRETLPEGFQRSEFLLEHGAIDMIVDRRDLRDRIAALLALMLRRPPVGGARSRLPTEMSTGQRCARLSDWLDWQQTLHPHAIDLGLGRVARVLARTGWRRGDQPVITVGGTNGKGSCVAMLDAILRASGYRVGTFTSPHLIDYRERVRLDGRMVSEASLVAAFERIADALGDDSLTFFEFNALAALLVFETFAPDVIVLEVGMGGRLDAVNVVDPDVAIVASVGLDHTEWLGSDVEAIGREKAGIFRKGRPAICGMPVPPRVCPAGRARLRGEAPVARARFRRYRAR